MRKVSLFFLVAALLGAALILGGCPTEAETETVYVTADPEMIHIDVLASNEGELNQYLAEEGDLVIGVGSTITLVAALEIPEGKVVYILNSGKLSTAAGFGLTVKGTVYVGIGGELDVSAAAAALTGEGKVSVLKSSYTPPADVAATGTLTISAATDVNNGGTTVLGTEQVPILGTLKYSAGATFADPAAVVAALAYVPKGTLDVGDVVEVKAFLPSAVATAATGKVSAGQLLFATANGVETATTLTVPAGLVLTTTDGLGTVTTLTVNSGLIAGSAVLEDDPGATITVGAGAYAELGTVAKVLADSSVGAGGTLTAVVTAFGDDATIAAAEGSTVNGITFPGATTVSAAAADALTIGDLTVPADGTLTVAATKTLTVAAGKTLTAAAGSTVNGITFPVAATVSGIAAAMQTGVTIDGLTLTATDALTIPDGTALTIAAGGELANAGSIALVGLAKVVLTGADATGGAKLTGTGKLTAGKTEIVGGTSGWQAVGASGSVTIGSSDIATVASISADTSVLTAQGAGATITQLSGTGNNLNISANTTIALGGVTTKVGEIVLMSDASAPGKLTLIGTITTGNTSASVTAASLSADGITVVADENTYTKIGVENLVGDGTYAKLEPTNAPASNTTSAAGNIVKLTGTADATIQGGASANGSISGATATVPDNT